MREAEIRKLHAETGVKLAAWEIEYQQARIRVLDAQLSHDKEQCENAMKEFNKVVGKLNALKDDLCICELLLIGNDEG